MSVWCVLVWCSLLPLTQPLNPSDPNVCSSWESYTVTSPETYLTPQDEELQEPCDDPRSDYRCTRHKITYRQMYRPGVQTEYRKRSHCCQGYYESRGVCVAQCSQECVHGRCVRPDLCQCEPGWRGPDCSSDCSDQTWGEGCAQLCACRNGAACHPATGQCSCPPGYQGPTCEEPCPAGTYGPGCLQQCRCQNKSGCDHRTGRCRCVPGTTGALCEKPCEGTDCDPQCPCQNGGQCTPGGGVCLCPPGWTGSVCSLRCPQGTFGVNCSARCQCHNGGQCDPVGGQCQCAPGYTGDRCQDDCPRGRYGQNCTQTCDCLNQARCMHVDGACLCAPGFQGNRCGQRLCHHQLYGHACNMQCVCDPRHTQSCHPITGVCTCEPGWSGPWCNESCAPTFYGTGCLNPCLCLNGGSCDPVTGQCICTPGYTGRHCSEVCPPWTYGHKCSEICQCQNAAFCSAVDGSCRCLSGWTGWDCTTPCAQGRWGPACNNTCPCTSGATCNPSDGTCICGPGWYGPRCELQCPVHLFGPGCTKQCNCERAKSCDRISGLCYCPPGRTGPGCERVCDAGRWGRDCAFGCRCLNGGQCHRENGSCLCTPGYSGPSCQHRLANGSSQDSGGIVPAPPADSVSLGAIIGIVALLAVVVFLLALFVCLRHRYGGKATSIPPVSYTPAVGSGSGEYAVPDVPQSYVHYYANPSYHTLPQCAPCPPPLPQLPNNLDRITSIKKTNNQLFRNKKNLEVERPGPLPDCNATLPADWKRSPKDKKLGVCAMDRSYSCSNSLPKYSNTDLCGLTPEGSNDGSGSSGENLYATIRDLPSLGARPPESSYVEMGSAGGPDQSYAEIGPYPEAGTQTSAGSPVGGGTDPAPRDTPGHYAWPKNSHIPGHYDLPPSRHHSPLPMPPLQQC